MKIKKVKLSEVKSNPNNPRIIKDEKFAKLVRSIKEFPKMLEIRPIVVNAEMVVLGGNMRLRACKEAGLKEIPIVVADDFSEGEQNEFIIKDNVGFGQWDQDSLANEWDINLLDDWGVDVPNIDVPIQSDEDFESRFNKMNDQTCLYPIVPVFDEDHEVFIIVCENEIDANWFREKLGMNKMISYKSAEISKSNIIHMEDVKKVL